MIEAASFAHTLSATPAPALALAAAACLAWAWDARWGEPGNAWHPVAWLGRLMGPIGRYLPDWPAAPAFVAGALVWWLLVAVAGLAAWAVQTACAGWPWWLAAPVFAVVLKPTFAWRMLRDEVTAVQAALPAPGAHGAADLQPARERLARLVSRDVSTMDAAQLRETALQTLSENLNDSVVAPLLWFALLGLPGAVMYRVANTADAMWGYRGRWEWAGKWAARADDVLSWLPARLTGLALAPLRCWPALPALARETPSPNGGWPMGALALRLGVRLRKPGVYALNLHAPSPSAQVFAMALKSTAAVAWGSAVVAALCWGWRA